MSSLNNHYFYIINAHLISQKCKCFKIKNSLLILAILGGNTATVAAYSSFKIFETV